MNANPPKNEEHRKACRRDSGEQRTHERRQRDKPVDPDRRKLADRRNASRRSGADRRNEA
ncbi:MAG TPA: hypothetical protein VIN57_06050 [Magnetovibrio sp.]